MDWTWARSLFRFIVFFLGLSFHSVALAQNSSDVSPNPLILKLSIRGTINPAVSRYLSRAIEQAATDQAALVLIELDTPGGLVSSTREMAQAMDGSPVPVVVYVSPAGASATSAGALLMISSHLAAMAPGTNIGAAHPVGAEGREIEGAAGDKAVNDVAAFARAMAKLRGRNTAVAADVVSKSASFSAEEALANRLIDVIAASPAELWKKIDGRQISMGARSVRLKLSESPEVRPVSMRPGERLLHALSHPNIAAILMTLGIFLIYAEFSSPGLGLPGILGGLCLVIAFMAFQALPIRTGGLALMALGAALLIAEVFTSSGGLLAGGGLVSFLLGLLWVIDPAGTDLRIAPAVWVISAGTLSIGTGLVVWAASRTKMLSRRALAEAGGGGLEGLAGYVGRVQRVAADGRSGKVLIRGELWNFETDVPLKVGDAATVLASNGLRLRIGPSTKEK